MMLAACTTTGDNAMQVIQPILAGNAHNWELAQIDGKDTLWKSEESRQPRLEIWREKMTAKWHGYCGQLLRSRRAERRSIPHVSQMGMTMKNVSRISNGNRNNHFSYS